jgi:drug/metabolite transporter (DMT)-like permease
MLSTGMMILLIAIYGFITVAALFERNWPRALYFVGAIIISVAVLWMTNGKAAHGV